MANEIPQLPYHWKIPPLTRHNGLEPQHHVIALALDRQGGGYASFQHPEHDYRAHLVFDGNGDFTAGVARDGDFTTMDLPGRDETRGFREVYSGFVDHGKSTGLTGFFKRDETPFYPGGENSLSHFHYSGNGDLTSLVVHPPNSQGFQLTKFRGASTYDPVIAVRKNYHLTSKQEVESRRDDGSLKFRYSWEELSGLLIVRSQDPATGEVIEIAAPNELSSDQRGTIDAFLEEVRSTTGGLPAHIEGDLAIPPSWHAIGETLGVHFTVTPAGAE